MKNISEYISENLKKCVRENTADDDTLIGLPYPYCVPCPGEAFREMYYWDTYFTNIGLLLSNETQQAVNNAENMAFLVRKFGFVPNGNRTYYTGRSQPPFFSQTVRDIFDKTSDSIWLEKIFDAVETECKFWFSQRSTPCGLLHYAPYVSHEREEQLYNYFRDRVGADVTGAKKHEIAQTTVIGCESGWDFSPRCGIKAFDYAQLDLNALAYGMLKNLEYFSRVLNNNKSIVYEKAAAKHALLIRKYMKDIGGVFWDYNYASREKSDIFSCASFYPLFFNMASKDEAEAAVKNLWRINQKHGISACEKKEVSGVYQWHYPNGWAPLHYIVIKGLINYGFNDIAIQLAKKFADLVETVFDETGQLWEKYNVTDGSVNVTNEYNMPPMMGWTFGVYTYCRKITEDSYADKNFKE